jgi:hypothetical protein
MVDLDVYRMAGMGVLTRRLLLLRIAVPLSPFAALLGVPLALLPPAACGWTAAGVLAIAGCSTDSV